MGLLLRYTRLSLGWATVIFRAAGGRRDLAGAVHAARSGADRAAFPAGPVAAEADLTARKIWDVLLLAYCLVAGVVPVWLLLQPRGHLGGYFLVCGAGRRASSAWCSAASRFNTTRSAVGTRPATGGETFLPFLFITIACGACSGFHSLIASGTTSKQLAPRDRRQADRLRRDAARSDGRRRRAVLRDDACRRARRCSTAMPNMIYADGIGQFLERAAHADGVRRGVRADGVHDVRVRHARRLHAAGPVHHAGADGPAQLGRPLAGHGADGRRAAVLRDAHDASMRRANRSRCGERFGTCSGPAINCSRR